MPTALLMVILFEAWKSFPFAFLFILARLQAVPGDIEEAARVDGATPTQVFRHIILPQLMGVIALIAVLRFIFTFNAFDEIYLLTGGGAGTEVLATQVYSFLTARNDVGASAAVAMFMAAVLAMLLLVYLRFFGERERAHETPPLVRYHIEVAALKILRPLGIAFFVLITLFPFYYMVLLSMREISAGDRVARVRSSSALGELSTDAYERVLKPTSEGGEGFVRFLHELGAAGASATVVVTSPSRSSAPTRWRGSSSSASAPCTSCSCRSTCSRRSCWRSRCSSRSRRWACAASCGCW